MNPCQAITRGVDFVLWASKELALGAVNLTASVTRDVSGMRSIASSVTAAVDALGLFGLPVDSFNGLVQSCKSFNKGMGAINVFSRAGGFADGSAFSSLVRLIGRIVFIVYDILTSVEWLESMALVAKGTASQVTFAVFGTSSSSILPTMSFFGYAMDFADHAHNFWSRGPSWDAGLSMGTAAVKMVGIGLTGVAGPVAQWGKIASSVTATVIVFVNAARR